MLLFFFGKKIAGEQAANSLRLTAMGVDSINERVRSGSPQEREAVLWGECPGSPRRSERPKVVNVAPYETLYFSDRRSSANFSPKAKRSTK